MFTLYQFEISPFCDKIRRILHVKGLDYRVREVPMLEATLGYRKVNPIGKVPCLELDGERIADSTEIAHWLEQRHPEPPLVPRDAAERGLCHMLEDWADESLYFYEMRMRFMMGDEAKRWVPKLLENDPPALRGIAGLAVPRVIAMTTRTQGIGKKPDDMVLREVERHVASIAGWLGDRPWLVGSRLSLADISVFAQMFCIAATAEGERITRTRPSVVAWMDRVDQATRPSARAAGEHASQPGAPADAARS